MGLCLSVERKESNQRSALIDKIIEEDQKKLKRECKILLLGSGESGKSTIVKQMKIIHQNGYSKEELENFKTTVHHNILDSITDIAFALVKFKINVQPKLQPHVKFLLSRPTLATSLAHLPPTTIEQPTEGPPIFVQQPSDASLKSLSQTSVAASVLASSARSRTGSKLSQENIRPIVDARWFEMIASIWADPATTNLIDAHGSQFYLMDSAPYFFNSLKRIGDPSYVPNEADVLRARIKSTGISETRFTMGQLDIHMFDVGGQRSERKKWIHCFEAVTSIIFCVGLSEYDQVLLEESSQNRMAESLVLFESVINSRWFLRTSIILFLNKIDLFKLKLQKIPLELYFPEYGGGVDINKAAKYILWRFTQTNRAKLNIYPHLTQATDTSNVRLVFAAVKETILQNALKDSGIM